MLSWWWGLLACGGGVEAAETPAVETHTGVVVVRAYREQDISKRKGHPLVHGYATLQLVQGDEALWAHADQEGSVRFNHPVRDLEGTGRWDVGQVRSIAATVSGSTEGYVRIVSSVEDGTMAREAGRWSGRVLLPAAVPGGPVEATPLVIDTQEGFDAFLATLPTTKVQQKQPAPPSDDPLLLSPPTIDWSSQRLLVARRDDMYVGPVVQAVVERKGELVVAVDHPDAGDTREAARMAGVGSYEAIVVSSDAARPVRWVLRP